MTVGQVKRTVDPVAVALTGLDGGDEAVPYIPVDLGELDPGLTAVVGDETDLDLVGDLGEEREVDAAAGERGSQGVGMARPDVHVVLKQLRIVPLRPLIVTCRWLNGTIIGSAGERPLDHLGCRHFDHVAPVSYT